MWSLTFHCLVETCPTESSLTSPPYGPSVEDLPIQLGCTRIKFEEMLYRIKDNSALTVYQLTDIQCWGQRFQYLVSWEGYGLRNVRFLLHGLCQGLSILCLFVLCCLCSVSLKLGGDQCPCSWCNQKQSTAAFSSPECVSSASWQCGTIESARDLNLEQLSPFTHFPSKVTAFLLFGETTCTSSASPFHHTVYYKLSLLNLSLV